MLDHEEKIKYLQKVFSWASPVLLSLQNVQSYFALYWFSLWRNTWDIWKQVCCEGCRQRPLITVPTLTYVPTVNTFISVTTVTTVTYVPTVNTFISVTTVTTVTYVPTVNTLISVTTVTTVTCVTHVTPVPSVTTGTTVNTVTSAATVITCHYFHYCSY